MDHDQKFEVRVILHQVHLLPKQTTLPRICVFVYRTGQWQVLPNVTAIEPTTQTRLSGTP